MADLKEVDEILQKYNNEKSAIVSILQDIQRGENYLPENILRHVAKNLNIPLSKVYSISSFYRAFSLEPRGKHLISVCLGTACHVRGAPRILEKLERELGIKAGGTTKDLKFTLETVNCLGACALGPIVVVDGEYNGGMTQTKIDKLMKKYMKRE